MPEDHRPQTSYEKTKFSSGGKTHYIILRGKWGLAIDTAVLWLTGYSLQNKQYCLAHGTPYIPCLLLTTTGARTGKQRTCGLPFWRVDNDYIVFHNDTALPRLRLSRSYREVARDKASFKGENKEFISNKLNNANWMLQAIEQRRQTMLKVMNFIVNRQRDFFEEGIEQLKPLTLREVAEVINMHESTVSRVTNQKYVQTPRGVFPLKFFFSSGLSTDSGEDVSARGIKARIQKLVSDEDPKKPLTDQAIVDILKREGINIARRTVAKYRDQLGILSARMR